MLKCGLFFILAACLLPAAAGAASSTVMAGVSQSDEKAFAFKSAPGLLLGNAFAWHPAPRISLTCELDLHYKRIALAGKLVWQHPGILSLYDLTVKALYLEVPVLVGYTFPIRGSQITLYAGPSLHLCLSGAVHRTGIRMVDDSYVDGSNPGLPDYDISFIEDPGPTIALSNSAFGFTLGMNGSWLNREIGLRYTYSRLDELDAVKFDKPYHALTLVISLW